MHWDTFKQDNYSTVGGNGGCRVGEVRAGIIIPLYLTTGSIIWVWGFGGLGFMKGGGGYTIQVEDFDLVL